MFTNKARSYPSSAPIQGRLLALQASIDKASKACRGETLAYSAHFLVAKKTVLNLDTSGLYYKHMTIVNDDSSIISEQSF